MLMIGSIARETSYVAQEPNQRSMKISMCTRMKKKKKKR